MQVQPTYNIKKSITIGCAKKSMLKKEVSERLGISLNQVQVWQRSNQMTLSRASDLAAILGLTLSEFIALGEE